MTPIHLPEELRKIRNRREPDPLGAYKTMFREVDREDDRALDAVRRFGSGENRIHNPDPDRLFREEDIRAMAIRYRLRFLDAALFKGEIPHTALAEVKRLDRQAYGNLSGFKILAPAGLFHLREKDKDPVLFLSLGKGWYYLVHQWGKDLHPLRALAVWPFRSFRTLFLCVLALATVVTFSFPDAVMMMPGDTSSWPVRGILFFYCLFALSGLTALYGFSRMRDFSSTLWNLNTKD